MVSAGVWEGGFYSMRFHSECSPQSTGFSGEFPDEKMKRGSLEVAA